MAKPRISRPTARIASSTSRTVRLACFCFCLTRARLFRLPPCFRFWDLPPELRPLVFCFALLRPLVRRYVTPRTERTNADRLIGREAVVTQQIDNISGTGQVRVGGQIWTARSENENDPPVEPGVKATVLRIEGVKLIVQPVHEKKGVL